MPQGVTLRAEEDRDRAFLEALFISIRWSEFDPAGWPDEVRNRFLAGQFALQFRHYHDCRPGADFAIMERDGAPIGRLYVFEDPGDVHLVDISLVAEARRSGIGTALLNSVMARAASAGKSVSLHVDRNNPARRLYQRLGFIDVSENDPYILMRWRS